MQSLVDFLNEVGMLAHTPRSGFAFLGTGAQSVAEHSHRVALIAFFLARMHKGPIDMSKLLLMGLLHDLPEARTGDLNYVNKRYVQADEKKVVQEIKEKAPYGAEIAAYIDEYVQHSSEEALLAHDADQIEMLLVLKKLYDIGNPQAMTWFDSVVLRLKTETAQELSETIRNTPSDHWWMDKLK